MLLTEANDILAKSYSKLGDLAVLRARNISNGYGRSVSQRKLYEQSRMIELNLGSTLDHLLLDDSGNIVSVIRSTDEQINRFLKVLESVSEVDAFATPPLLHFPKKRYILKNQQIASTTPLPNGIWMEQGLWDGSFNTFPVLGALGDSVKKGYTWETSVATTSLLGSDGGIIPVGATIRSLSDTPGQTLSNWRIHY